MKMYDQQKQGKKKNENPKFFLYRSIGRHETHNIVDIVKMCKNDQKEYYYQKPIENGTFGLFPYQNEESD